MDCKTRLFLGVGCMMAFVAMGCSEGETGSHPSDVTVTGECSGSETKCSGNDLKTCVNKHYVVKKCVSGVCTDNQCTGDGGSYSDETCGDSFAETCKDGKHKYCYNGFVATAPCKSGCGNDNKCKDNNTVVEDGESCNVLTYTPVCDSDGVVKKCVGGKITKVTCESSAPVCKNGLCQSLGACTGNSASCPSEDIAERCESGQKVQYQCNKESQICQGGTCIDLSTLPACDGTTMARCVDGNNKKQQVCRNNHWVTYDCPPDYECNGGVCSQLAGTKCTHGDTHCVAGDNTIYEICESGIWKTVSCNTNSTCQASTGSCVPDSSACSPRCKEGNIAVTCNGNTPVEVFCNNLKCSGGACLPNTCTKSECKNDLVLKVCSGETFTSEQDCSQTSQHCDNGACVANQSENSTCDVAVFKNTCISANSYQICDGGTIKNVTCTAASGGDKCLNGRCVECDPETYVPQCEAGETSYKLCINGKLEPQNCIGNTPVCHNAQCVACKPNTTSCKTGDTNHYYSCDDSYQLVASECPPGLTCEGGSCTKPCSTTDDCPKDANHPNLYTCEGNQCKFKPECNLTDPAVCTDNKKIKKCVGLGVWEEKPCDGNDTCIGDKCVGNDCDDLTYGVQCNGSTRQYCSNKHIVQLDTCPSICKDGQCVECDPSTFPSTCISDKQKKSCELLNGSQYHIVTTTCGGICKNNQCIECDPNVYPAKCTAYNQMQSCKLYNGEYRIVTTTCSGMCGVYNGKPSCMATCDSSQVGQGDCIIDGDDTVTPMICQQVTTTTGTGYGYAQKVDAFCYNESGSSYSVTCNETTRTWDSFNCGKVSSSSTCQSSSGTCSGSTDCGEPRGYCSASYAMECVQHGNTKYLTTTYCGTNDCVQYAINGKSKSNCYFEAGTVNVKINDPQNGVNVNGPYNLTSLGVCAGTVKLWLTEPPVGGNIHYAYSPSSCNCQQGTFTGNGGKVYTYAYCP